MNKRSLELSNISVTKETIFWKISVVVLGTISLSTGIFKFGGFWSSYVLDMVGPAWGYILIRAQYQTNNSTFLSLKFSSELALSLIVGICFTIETMQFFKLYDSTFDPFDFLFYFLGIFTVYLIDKVLRKRKIS